jgi:hypothetical protein
LSHTRAQIAALPIAREAFETGVWAGLLMALDILTNEIARQNDQAAAATGADSSAAMPHEFAAGRLRSVARIVAARFRQTDR